MLSGKDCKTRIFTKRENVRISNQIHRERVKKFEEKYTSRHERQRIVNVNRDLSKVMIRLTKLENDLLALERAF